MKIIVAVLLSLSAAFTICPAVAAPDGGVDKSEMLDSGVVRQISNDICLPATAEEYEELGKHAILALDSTSVISTELPLRSVYVIYKDVRIPLQKITTLPKNQTKDGATQVSFYLLPIKYMKSDAKLFADFSGDRKEFGITTFAEREGLDPAAPAFARLDAYDTPFDPDMSAVERVILREYPQHFSQSSN
jgi:hypothetical protein